MLILSPGESWDGGRGPQKANMKNKPAVRWLKNILIDFLRRIWMSTGKSPAVCKSRKLKGWCSLDKSSHILTVPTWERQYKLLFLLKKERKLEALAPAQGTKQCPCCFFLGCKLFVKIFRALQTIQVHKVAGRQYLWITLYWNLQKTSGSVPSPPSS